MATYITLTGDTFDRIARKEYGTEQEAGRIKRANPGLTEPFSAGISVAVPPLPNAPKNKPQETAANDINEVAVLINGKRFRFWTSSTINRHIDSIDTIEFSAPFEPSDKDVRETFRPGSFKDLQITVGGKPLFTGTLIGVAPVLSKEKRTVSVTGYALPGVLNDCNASAAMAESLENDNQTLKDIAATLVGPFGLSVVFDVEPGPIFERTKCATGKKVLTYLAELAKQQNLIINSTEQGALRFTQSVTVGKPVAVLKQGESPVLSVTPTQNMQQYYSHITGFQPTMLGIPGVQHTEKNPFLTGVVRPLSFEAPDTEDSNVPASVKAKIGRMFGNIISYSVSVSTWRDPSGELWKPNTTIKLEAPGAMIYNSYEFIIRSVSLTKTSSSESAVLTLVLPGAFSGEIPEALPWDD